jgi:protein-S-isoprenylcysteine O-methyltransferase Ste14/membrane-associated phospholipid phosphatase
MKSISENNRGLEAQAEPARNALTFKSALGIALYALLFVVILPLALAAWADFAGPNVSLPPVRAVLPGLAAALSGSLLLLAGMVSLAVYGHGLPMNPYPPPLYVSRGAYRLLRHPIYAGFSLICLGLAVATGSASGLWLVCPVVILGCAALVLGYENMDLRKRFGERLPEPLLRIPSAGEAPPDVADRLSVYFIVLLPWLILYELLAGSGMPRDAVSSLFPWESTLPVLAWTEVLYAGTYLLVLLVPWVAATKRVLRAFAIQGLVASLLMVLFFTTIPLIAPPRPFTPHTFLGEVLAWERRLDTPSNAFPSYHVFWALLALSVLAARNRRWRYFWWTLGVAISLSCLTTGMHGVIDVLGGALLFLALKNLPALWHFLRRQAEQIANSWREWQWGRVRIINHGMYAGIGAGLAVAIVGCLTGSGYTAPILLVAFAALIASALWAQFVEGSPSLLRPYGYYGGVLGIVLGSLLAALFFGANPWLLLAAYSVAGPWVQSFGRLRCLVQGCCHGHETVPEIGIVYRHPRSRVCRLAGLQGVPLHPTPLYSILWNVLIAAVMTRLWFAGSPLALIGGVYLILTGLGRFVEEACRGEPQTLVLGGLRFYQWIALVTVLAGAVVTCIRTEPASGHVEFSGRTVGMALFFGAITWFALGVDFPASNRRFARLA